MRGYHQEGVFSVMPRYHGVIRIRLNYGYWTLPQDFSEATGTTFWKEVDDAILSLCPGSEKPRYCMGSEDERWGETWICPGPPDTAYKDTLLGADILEQQCERIENTLEMRAEQRWLRPGVPALLVMVKKYLKNKKHLIASTREFQRCHSYAATKTVINQFEDYRVGMTFLNGNRRFCIPKSYCTPLILIESPEMTVTHCGWNINTATVQQQLQVSNHCDSNVDSNIRLRMCVQYILYVQLLVTKWTYFRLVASAQSTSRRVKAPSWQSVMQTDSGCTRWLH